jgi:hypothetical protein
MSDWRTNPRQGRSQFLPLLGEVKKRLALGETMKMIFESYPELKMSYAQFTRYIKKYCEDEIQAFAQKTDNAATALNNNEIAEQVSETKQRVRNPADLRRLRNKDIDLDELKNSTGEENDSSNS